MIFQQYALRLALLGLLSLVSAASADDARKETESLSHDVTPSVGEIVTGSELLGATLHDKNDVTVGKVEDIVLDPYHAKAVSLVVKPTAKVQRERRLLVPCELVEPLEGGKLRATVTAEMIEDSATSLTKRGSQPYTRRLSVATFRHYSLQPYWLQQSQAEEATDRDDRFEMLTDLKRKTVKSPDGESLGKIANVVISQTNGKIVYTLFVHQHREDRAQQSETRKFPIPLAAFVVPHHGDEWLLELPEFALDNTQRVEQDKLPKELSRAWVEYIHVRYGGGVFSGVQRELKTTK